MPPKKISNLAILKKQLAKESQKKERVVKPKYPPPKEPTASGIKLRINEEDTRRKFFYALLAEKDKLTDEQLLSKLSLFGSDPTGKLFRASFIKQLTSKLSASLIYEFARDYISQEKKSTEFLKEFLTNPDVAIKIEELAESEEEENIENTVEREESEGEEIDYGETEEPLVQAPRERILEIEEEIPVKKSREPLKVTKLIENEIEIVPRKKWSKTYTKKYETNKCARWYSQTPWLTSPAQIWISPVSGDNAKFYLANNIQDIEGEIYYQANQNFIFAQCNFYRNQRVQTGDVLTFFDDSGEEFSVKVAFQLDDEIIIQDEELFELEKEEYLLLSAPLSQKIQNLLAKPVNSLVEKELKVLEATLSEKLTVSLSLVGLEDKQLVKEIIKRFLSREDKNISIKIFLEKFAIFLTIFDLNILDYAKIFKERLAKSVFSAEYLSNLTIVQILPEVFNDPRVSLEDREIFQKYITSINGEKYLELAYTFYYNFYPSERRGNINVPPSIPPAINLPENGLKDLCVNSEKIDANITPYNLYVYQEGDKFYCFDLANLPLDLDVFGENPETGENLPDQVYQEIQVLAQKLKQEKEILPKVEEDHTVTLDPKITKILRVIMDDILSLEDEIGNKGADFWENGEQLCAYCQKVLAGNKIFSTLIKDKKNKLAGFCDLKCFEQMKISKAKEI